ncbi:YaaC family protein [Raoultella ornithinolytica]|uniref:YaaC family protein n=1 Tax=Raoultella ornithinolytica TaxID=54291 RepID=UPI003D549293
MTELAEVEIKYGFPLFSKPSSLVNLGRNEKIVISDIWAFWDYVIKKTSSDRKEEDFLRSLLEQAKHFYITAENSPVKSQPLLYYYSFLNLSKIIINLTNTHGPKKMYMHGMSENHNNRFSQSTITKQKQKKQIVQVAHEIVSIFDPNIANTDVILNVKDILNHCVGVHRAYSEIYNQTEVFYKIANYKLFKKGKELIFKAELQCSDIDMVSLTARGYWISKDENGIFHYTAKITMPAYKPTRKDYAELSREIQNKGIWYFIGNTGYTMYLSNSSIGRYSQESIIYMVMFYLGSITRYHPYMFDEIFSDKEQWLMSEFLNTQPKQFLYLATARILGQSVLKAYASF